MKVLLPALLSLVFVIIAWFIVRYGLKVAFRARQSSSWPSTEGEISHSAALVRSNRTSSGDSGPTYEADVAYRYRVNGTDYSSSRVTYWIGLPLLGARRVLWPVIPVSRKFWSITTPPILPRRC